VAVTERFIAKRALPTKLDLPPGPRLPVIAQTMMFMAGRTTWSPIWQRRYGDVFSVHVAPAGRAVVLGNPEHVREVFAGASDVFHAGEGNAILGPVMGEHSVLLLDEKEHLETRKRVMSAFHGEATTAWASVIEDLAADTIARWPIDTPFPVHPDLNDISLEVILRIVFGVTDDTRLATLRPLLQQLIRIGPLIFLGWVYPQLDRIGPWRRFNAIKAKTDAAIYREIADRRQATDLADRTDVLSKLLVAAPAQSDAELRDHLVTLLLAGHETTASTLAWTLHDLARVPEVQARVQRAADRDDDDYIEATVKESMRLRPVIGTIARRLNKPARVGDYDLPAGIVVFPSIYLVHHRASVYPSPGQFRPERFLGSNPPPATWIPFGGGIRRCLGAALAMVEAKAVLKTVMRRVDVAPGGRAEAMRTRNVTMIPARGARIAVRPR
jgi:cytochrome P450